MGRPADTDPEFASRYAIQIVLFIISIVYWTGIERIIGKYPSYMSGEAVAVLSMEPLDFLKPIVVKDPSGGKWGDYVIFAPLGFNAAAALDRYVVAPLVLGKQAEDPAVFSYARRLAPLHILCLAALTVGAFLFLRYLTGHIPAAVLGAAYLGLNHGASHPLSFVSTFGLYGLLAGGMLAVAGIVEVCRGTDTIQGRTLIKIGCGLALAVLSHGQAGALPLVLLAISAVAVLFWRVPFGKLMVSGCLLPGFFLVLYFTMHLGHGLGEINGVTESQYMFPYPSLTLKIEEAMLNISAHIANTIDGILFPWPMQSVAVMKNINMDLHNKYNLVYSQWPNMHYRMFGMWYIGLLFGAAIFFSAKIIRLLVKNRSVGDAVPAVGLLLLWGGFFMHIPVMFRDYFLIPGFDIGYKASLSHLGFSIILAWAVVRYLQPRLAAFSLNRQGQVIGGIFFWIALCNFGKIALNKSYNFPW